jgi:hypothetical protein
MEWHWDGVNCSTSKLLDTIVEEATRDAQACETLLKILSVEKEQLCELVIQQATMKADLETKHFCWSNNCSSRDSYIPLLQTIAATSAHHHRLEEEKWQTSATEPLSATSSSQMGGCWKFACFLLPRTLGTKVETKKYPAVGSFLLC